MSPPRPTAIAPSRPIYPTAGDTPCCTITGNMLLHFLTHHTTTLPERSLAIRNPIFVLMDIQMQPSEQSPDGQLLYMTENTGSLSDIALIHIILYLQVRITLYMNYQQGNGPGNMQISNPIIMGISTRIWMKLASGHMEQSAVL